MVRQAYINRLALGRSAFEPPSWPEGRQSSDNRDETSQQDRPTIEGSDYRQHYNVRGHPENLASRLLARRSRRAQNDVLSTVGVCVCVDSNGKIVSNPNASGEPSAAERRIMRAIEEENETGLAVGVAEDFLRLMATTFVSNLRRRFETFVFYVGITPFEITRTELKHFGFFTYFFAGEFASTAFYIIDTTLCALMETARDSLIETYANDANGEGIHKYRMKRFIIKTEWAIRNIFHLLLVPIQFYGTLQRLNLCPAWPLLPNAFSKSYFQPMLPPLPTIWNRRSLGSYAASLVFSPLATYTYMTIFHITVNSKLGVYTRAGLPRPDNPDSASMRLGDDPDTAMTAPVLEYPKLQGSVHQEFNKDLQHIRASIKRVESFVLSSYRQLSYILGVPTVSSSTMESHADTRAHPVRFAQDPLSPTTTPLESPEQNPAINPGIHPAQTQLSSSTSTPSPPRSPTSSQDPDSPALEPSNVQIRTRTGSTSTLHMDVEVNAPLNGGPVFTSSFAASPRPAILESNAPPTVSEPHYRVTALTLHPSDSLGSLIANLITNTARLPFESLYLRSLATAYVAAGEQPGSRSWLGQNIFPLSATFGSGFGPPGMKGRMDYASRIAMCLFAEAVIGVQVWWVGCAAAVWAGQRWYKWGRL